jgi:hypothetical protein
VNDDSDDTTANTSRDARWWRRLRPSWVVAAIALVVVAWGVVSASPVGFWGLFLLAVIGVPLLVGRGLLSVLRVRHRWARVGIYTVLILAGLCIGVWLFARSFKPQM